VRARRAAAKLKYFFIKFDITLHFQALRISKISTKQSIQYKKRDMIANQEQELEQQVSELVKQRLKPIYDCYNDLEQDYVSKIGNIIVTLDCGMGDRDRQIHFPCKTQLHDYLTTCVEETFDYSMSKIRIFYGYREFIMGLDASQEAKLNSVFEVKNSDVIHKMTTHAHYFHKKFFFVLNGEDFSGGKMEIFDYVTPFKRGDVEEL